MARDGLTREDATREDATGEDATGDSVTRDSAAGDDTGMMPGGLQYHRTGRGSPLVFLRTLTPSHENPRGLSAWAERRMLEPAARNHTVYALGHAPHLPRGIGMGELAAQYARAIDGFFDSPVPVVGLSTSAAIALQLAADHQQLVSRLVVVAGASRLGDAGRRMQQRYAERLARGDRAAGVEMMPFLGDSALARLLVSTAVGLAPLPPEPDGLIAMLDAEDGFDLTHRLDEVVAPTLVVAGGRDAFYPPDLTRATAEGVRDGRLVLYPHRRHPQVPVGRRFAADIEGFLA